VTQQEELKLQLIELCGSLEAAKEAFNWVIETVAAPVEPAPTPEGIVLTDAEVLASSPDSLWNIAMARLAVKQNQPQPVVEVAEKV